MAKEPTIKAGDQYMDNWHRKNSVQHSTKNAKPFNLQFTDSAESKFKTDFNQTARMSSVRDPFQIIDEKRAVKLDPIPFRYKPKD